MGCMKGHYGEGLEEPVTFNLCSISGFLTSPLQQEELWEVGGGAGGNLHGLVLLLGSLEETLGHADFHFSP